jgi:hypothetical protein
MELRIPIPMSNCERWASTTRSRERSPTSTSHCTERKPAYVVHLAQNPCGSCGEFGGKPRKAGLRRRPLYYQAQACKGCWAHTPPRRDHSRAGHHSPNMSQQRNRVCFRKPQQRRTKEDNWSTHDAFGPRERASSTCRVDQLFTFVRLIVDDRMASDDSQVAARIILEPANACQGECPCHPNFLGKGLAPVGNSVGN